MDRKTFDQIRSLHEQIHEVVRTHEPTTSEEQTERTPEQRFKALGRAIMDSDRFPRTTEFGGKVYRKHSFLPDGVDVTFMAEMSDVVDYPTVDDLVTVKAEWHLRGGADPLHVDKVSNVSDRHGVSEYDLRRLALVEESFAEAMQQAAV